MLPIQSVGQSTSHTSWIQRAVIFPANAPIHFHCAVGSLRGCQMRSFPLSHDSLSCVRGHRKCGTPGWWIWTHMSDSSCRHFGFFINDSIFNWESQKPHPDSTAWAMAYYKPIWKVWGLMTDAYEVHKQIRFSGLESDRLKVKSFFTGQS